jgi:hypothetical protein
LKHIIPLILTLSLLGCQTPPADVTPPAPTASHTAIPTAAPTLTPTPTEVPLEALPVEEIVQKYLAGEIDDVSVLNFEKQKDFSIALNEHRNEQRGPNPIIYTDRNGDKFYVDPVTLDFAPINDGTTAEQQTIEMYVPRVVDDEGYTHVFYNGEWVKIEGSQNIQFDNFENFNWPDTEIVDPQWVVNQNLLGLTIPEYGYRVSKGRENMVPIFFLSKETGEINIPGFGSAGALIGHAITENNPFSVRATILTGQPRLYGDDLFAGSPGSITEVSDFYKKLETGNLYYLMYEIDQKKEFATSYPKSNGEEVTTAYKGLSPSDQAHSIITGNLDSKNLTLIRAIRLVEAGKKTDN